MLRSSRPYGSADDGGTRGSVRASAAARPAIRIAATANGARQPRASARIPDAVRASSTPMRTPLITVPTTRPRSASGARMLANGIRIWTTTEVVAASPRAAASTATPAACARVGDGGGGTHEPRRYAPRARRAADGRGGVASEG